MRYVRYAVIALIVLVPYRFVAYGDEPKPEAQPATTAQEMKKEPAPAAPEAKQEAKEEKHDHAMGQEKRFVATVGADGVQHVEVIGGEYYFDPNRIIVKVNTPVELKLKKAAGYVPHNLLVKAPEAGIDFKADLGTEWKVVKFTPTKVGKYEMICDKRLLWFKSHKDRGMDGFIEVVQ